MSADHLRIMCPNLSCRKVLAVPQSARGKTVRCKACSTSIKVPLPKGSSPSDKSEKPAA